MANELTKIPKFRRCVLQNFPFIEQDFDALTDYQLLCKVVEYLNKVITSQNELITITESLAISFNELRSFVEDYFANLDVQDEINNKLDQMAEDGTLQEIITAYIQANVTWSFDTVADMKLATNLVAGSYARTLGFHSLNDGGGALYHISDTGTADEKTVIAVGSLFANIVYNGVIKPEQLGCKCNENYDDAPFIQECIDLSKSLGIKVEFAHDTYFIRTMIDIPTLFSIDFQGVTLKAKYALEDGMINVKSSNNVPNGTLSNVILDQNNVTQNGLYLYWSYRRTYQDITILNTPANGYGIYITTAEGKTGGGNLFNNIKGITENLNTTFIHVDTGDNTFTNVDYINYIVGFEIYRFTRLYDIHGFVYDTADDDIDRYTGSYFIKVMGANGSIQADNLYPDTQEFVIYNEQSNRPSTIGTMFYVYNDTVPQGENPIEIFKANNDNVTDLFYRWHVDTLQLSVSSARLLEIIKNTTRNPLATTLRIDHIVGTTAKEYTVPPTFVDRIFEAEQYTKLGIYGSTLICKGTSPYATTGADRKVCKVIKQSMCNLLDGYYPIVCTNTNNEVFESICQVISNEVYIKPNAKQTADYTFEIAIPVQLTSTHG